MPAGATAVHDAILNVPSEDTQTALPRTLPEETKTEEQCTQDGTRLCFRCKVYKAKADGYEVGRGNSFVCKACNALEGRVKRLCAGKHIGKLWRDMDEREKIAWRAEFGALQGACLRDRLTVVFTQRLLTEEAARTGGLGEHIPLGVYRTQATIRRG